MNKTQHLRKPKVYQKKQGEGLFYKSRGLLLYFLPVALIPASMFGFVHGDIDRIVLNIGGCATYLLAASLLRKGMAAEKQYQNKKITQPPKWALKTLSAVIVSITTGWIAFMGAGHSVLVSLVFGVGAMAGMSLFYGLDPRREKMVTGSHGYSAEEISQTIDEAELQIAGIKEANKQIHNRIFNQRIQVICEHAQNIVDMLEEDPGDIRKARKFLNVYLDGALKVTEGYADMQRKHQSEELTENFDNVLKTIESVFIEQKQKLLEDDILDLDVQIEVLAAQLKHEGVI